MSVSLEFPRRSDRRQNSGSRSLRGSSGPVARSVERCLLTKQIAQPACGTVARSAVRRGSAPDPAPVQRGRAERHSPLFRPPPPGISDGAAAGRLSGEDQQNAFATVPLDTSRPPSAGPETHARRCISRLFPASPDGPGGEPLRGGWIAVAAGLSRRTPGPPAATMGCSPPLGSPASADGVALTDGWDHPSARQPDW